MDNKFNTVLKIIRNIDDRDIYVRFYDKFLAVRLLQNIYASTELEKSMVTKLRGSYGVEFVKKSQQMLQDMSVSEGVNREFNEVTKDTKVSTKVDALKSGFWPLNQNQPDFQIPAEISSSVQSYHNFFTKKCDNRKLQWNYGASTNDVQFEHLEERHTITMTTYQMAILLCFNDVVVASVGQIQEITQLPVETVIDNLSTLVKNKIIDLETELPINQDSEFCLNMDIVNKRSKFGVLQTKTIEKKQQEEDKEADATVKATMEERKYCIKACIVRIMKSKKHLKHLDLMQEVVNQLQGRFLPPGVLIRQMIELLIKQEYLEHSRGAVRSAASSDMQQCVWWLVRAPSSSKCENDI